MDFWKRLFGKKESDSLMPRGRDEAEPPVSLSASGTSMSGPMVPALPETAVPLRKIRLTSSRAVADFAAERTGFYVERLVVTRPMLIHVLSADGPNRALFVLNPPIRRFRQVLKDRLFWG
jgi:hypothetical protein